MKLISLTKVAALASLALASLFSMSSQANPVAPVQGRIKLATASGATQMSHGLIIKYRQGSGGPKGLSVQYAGQSAAGLGFYKASEAASKRGVSLTFERPLATGGYLLRQSVALKGQALNEMIREIAADPMVEYVEPDRTRHAMGVPNDPWFPYLWYMQGSNGGINMPAAWNVANGSGVRVAVIDSGVTAHPDLSSNLVGGYDFISDVWTANDGNGRDADPSDPGDWMTSYESFAYCDGSITATNSTWHGTHVAGLVGSVTNNGVGVAGVAFGAQVVPIRVLGKCGGFVSDIADAVIWAAGGSVAGVPANPYPAKVINLSLGGDGACSVTEQSAINIARSMGALVVVSAGNEGTDTSNASPASCLGVLAVAATTQAGAKEIGRAHV
jgi:serine protease